MQTFVNTITRACDEGASGSLGQRRVLFAGLSLATAAGLMALMVATLWPGGIQPIDVVVLVLFAVTLPYAVVGFWNAVIGFVIMRFSRDPLALACPPAAGVSDALPITARTAILSCVRNEDVDPVFERLAAMLDSLDHAGLADRFGLFVLSDTNFPDVAVEEEQAFARLKARFGDRFRMEYRRRTENPGFKAGNIRDFCDRWGAEYDFALTLDADSYMSAEAMARLVRVMQANPRLGILQSLVVALPAESGFARMFQFGMRLGMRSHTMGAAWWQGDCGPYWGHNAVIRLAPFMADCHMPTIPGSGPLSGDILSHDQVEAALMRRAGYAVRVIPVEDASWEENPPALTEFVRRDLRWCAGNMQYLRLLGMDGLHPLSRVQLLLAINMFLGSAAWIGMVAIFTAGAVLPAGVGVQFDPAYGGWMFLAVMAMMFAPKIATVLDIVSNSGKRARFGGLPRFVAAVLGEVVFFSLLAPIAALTITMFVVQLPFGRRMTWAAQRRDAHGVPLSLAVARFWPHTLAGLVLLAALWPLPLGVKLLAIPLVGGLLLSIPFAVLTATPAFGHALCRARLFAVPEEFDTPATLRAIHLPALAHQGIAGTLPAHGSTAAAVSPGTAADGVNP